jgi:hypothetical protein
MIDYAHADLFKKDSVKKDLILDFGDFKIQNNRLYSEAFELQESLCTQNELRFGCCEASVLKFKCRNEFGELKDKWFDASMVLNGNADVPFKIGSYRVFSDEPSGDKKYKNITAYDAMYGVINAEMVEWYDGLTFSITMKDFRDSFFAYLGLAQVEIELVNDNMLIDKTIDADSISGKQIITAICELNGVFGHINRQGLFEYISLAKRKQMIYPGMEDVYPGSGIYPGMLIDNYEEALYPSEELFPSEDLFPFDKAIRKYPHDEVSKSRYISCEYEDFETQIISKLQIRQEENDIGATYGTGTNTYIVQDNFLVYGKSTSDLKNIAKKLFVKINGIYYRPFKANLQGNPCIEVGDVVVVHTRYKEVESYVLERTIKGIQALRDTFESQGVYEYAEKINSTNKEIKKLKGKTNKLVRTVEMLNSEINDEETGLKSQIEQTSEKVETKVSKGEVSSEISVELGKILLQGNRIAIESDYFTLSEDGKLHAIDGVFEGDIITKNAIINGGMITIRDEDNPNVFLIKLRRTDSAGNVHYVYINSSSLLSVYDSMYAKMTPNGFNVGSISGDPDGESWSETSEASIGPSWSWLNSLRVRTELAVDGTKKRIVDTKNYNTRSLYCYEMPSPIFGDVGHGVIGSDGLCYVDIDQIFFETVDMQQSYQVFLQSYAESNVYVIEKQSQYFVVKGLPNTEFDWELKAKQLDFPTERLEENFDEDDYKEIDYVASASAYLNEYEQEVLNYE